MGYVVDVKSTHLTASGDVFAGPARVLAVYYCSEGAVGTIEIRDGGATSTVLAIIDVPKGTGTEGEDTVYQVEIPGNGLYCRTSAYAKLTGGVGKVTVFYG